MKISQSKHILKFEALADECAYIAASKYTVHEAIRYVLSVLSIFGICFSGTSKTSLWLILQLIVQIAHKRAHSN